MNFMIVIFKTEESIVNLKKKSSTSYTKAKMGKRNKIQFCMVFQLKYFLKIELFNLFSYPWFLNFIVLGCLSIVLIFDSQGSKE